MTTLVAALANNIVKYRKALNLNQEGLAKKVGTSRQTITKYESGSQDLGISVEMIARIAKALEVNETDLFQVNLQSTPLRVVETTKELAQRVEEALMLMDVVTPELAELLLKADKETKRLFVEGTLHWVNLSDEAKGAIVEHCVIAAEDEGTPLHKNRKLKA